MTVTEGRSTQKTRGVGALKLHRMPREIKGRHWDTLEGKVAAR